MARILAVSDTHGMVNLDRIADKAIRTKADVLVMAGDIMPADIRVDQKTYFREEFLGMAYKLHKRGIEVVATPGNHDLFFREMGELEHPAHVLCDREIMVKDIRFYCTPWVPYINGRWAYEEEDSRLPEKFAKIPTGIDVLVSHTPPIGGTFDAFDVSIQGSLGPRRHLGSNALLTAIYQKKPKVVVCGHIHSGDHALGRIMGTAIINCSLVDEHYHEAYKPAEIQFVKGEFSFRTNGGLKWRKLSETWPGHT